MAAYDANLKRWPVPYECLVVPTRHGQTHAIASGRPDAPPLMLMRGVGGNATAWVDNIADLSQDHRTYALDVIGETGRSAPCRPSYKGTAYGEWFVDILDALKVGKAHVVGVSRGAWLALKIALFAPERVKRMVLLGTEGIAATSLKFLTMRMVPALLFPSRVTVHHLMRSITPPELPVNERLVEERVIIYKHFRQAISRPPMLADDELRGIRVPALLLFGQYEVLYNANAVIKRVQRLSASLRIEVIPGAGHVLSDDQPQVVDARILKFLKDGV
jgi:pimeloyl-ACP methyl ester carboxylesterase